LKTGLKCKFCGEDMVLEDEETRRWRCRKDDTTFSARQGGWIQGRNKNLATQAKVTSKSYLVGLACNIIPGGGLVYAGHRAWAMFYMTVTVVFLIVYSPIALIVLLASFIHTAAAIEGQNNEARLRAREPISHDKRLRPTERTICPRCGSQPRALAKHCTKCGTELQEAKRPFTIEPETAADETRVWA